jgi:hypothetical protein
VREHPTQRALSNVTGSTPEQCPHHRTAPGQADKLAVLLDALAGVALSSGERASLTWLAGFGAHTVENIAAVITRARQTR